MKKNIIEFLLEAEENNIVDYEISHRGGHYGLGVNDVVSFLFNDKSENVREQISDWLPNKVGVYCNYLGGGLRGDIVGGGYDKAMPEYAGKLIDEFAQCCKNRYIEIENESNLNEEEDENGETNWEAFGTNRARSKNIVSAY